MSNINGLAGFRSIGAGMLPNAIESKSTIPGLMPIGVGGPPIPDVIQGDRPVPLPLPPQPDPSPLAPKEPIYIGTVSDYPGINTAFVIGSDIKFPPGYVDPMPSPIFSEPPVVVVKPPKEIKGIGYLIDADDPHPIAVAITGAVLGLVGSYVGGTTGNVISVIEAATEVAQAQVRLQGGQPITTAKQQQCRVATSVPTGLTIGGGVALLPITPTCRASYTRIPITGTLMENVVTVHSLTMAFPLNLILYDLQLDLDCLVAFDEVYFYAPNLDDAATVTERTTVTLTGIDGAGVLVSTVGSAHFTGNAFRGYPTILSIEFPFFPTTANPNLSVTALSVSSFSFRYITRVDKEYTEDYMNISV